ncbi:MAG: DUF3025 domain-containing protein [Burkholderiales bacterium]
MADGLTDAWVEVRERLETPIFASVAELLPTLDRQAWPSLDVLNAISWDRGIGNAFQYPLRFVPPTNAGSAISYETQIAARGEVPTRQNLHDLFNALQWLSFPRLKGTVNAEHVKRLQLSGETEAKTRSKARDVLTMFDESGVIVASTAPSLLSLLQNFAWRELFVARRADVLASMRFHLVGHGLMEKALAPFIGITGKAILLTVDPTDLDRAEALDVAASAWLCDENNLTSATNLSPLPLLGVPGWDPRNEHATFYDNTDYFRTGRLRNSNGSPGPA